MLRSQASSTEILSFIFPAAYSTYPRFQTFNMTQIRPIWNHIKRFKIYNSCMFPAFISKNIFLLFSQVLHFFLNITFQQINTLTELWLQHFPRKFANYWWIWAQISSNLCTYCTHLAGFFKDDMSPWVLPSIHIQRRHYSEWGTDHDQMVVIKWSRISCQIFSVFMNKLRHEIRKKIPVIVHLSWLVQGTTANTELIHSIY